MHQHIIYIRNMPASNGLSAAKLFEDGIEAAKLLPALNNLPKIEAFSVTLEKI